MQAFVEYVVKGLVANPDDVVVAATVKDGASLYEVRVHSDDMGKVIGREGQTINIIRSLLQVGGARKNVRCSVELVDETGARREARVELPRERRGDRGFRGGRR